MYEIQSPRWIGFCVNIFSAEEIRCIFNDI